MQLSNTQINELRELYLVVTQQAYNPAAFRRALDLRARAGLAINTADESELRRYHAEITRNIFNADAFGRVLELRAASR